MHTLSKRVGAEVTRRGYDYKFGVGTYCQCNIPKNQWRYGFRSSAATGCGWIATYNALHVLGKHVALEKLIKNFERQLQLINVIQAIFFSRQPYFFLRHGYKVRCTAIPSHFDRIVEDSDVRILYVMVVICLPKDTKQLLRIMRINMILIGVISYHLTCICICV